MPTQPLTPTEYRAAIYLDFEGEGKKRDGTIPAPHMAGFFRPNQTGTSGKYSCVFFSPSFFPEFCSSILDIAYVLTFFRFLLFSAQASACLSSLTVR